MIVGYGKPNWDYPILTHGKESTTVRESVPRDDAVLGAERVPTIPLCTWQGLRRFTMERLTRPARKTDLGGSGLRKQSCCCGQAASQVEHSMTRRRPKFKDEAAVTNLVDTGRTI